MVLKTRTQHLIFALLAGLILLNLPVYLFLVRPEIAADANEGARIEQARRDLNLKMTALIRLKGIESRLTESNRSVSTFTQKFLFPRDKFSSELIRELDVVCSQSGLLRNRVAFTSSAEPQCGLQRISFTLPIEGSYSNIRKFLNILESRPRVVIVDSMVLESEREGTGLIRMDMNLSTYHVVQP